MEDHRNRIEQAISFEKQKSPHPKKVLPLSRRSFLRGSSGVIVATSTGLGAALATQKQGDAIEIGPLNSHLRQEKAFQIRRDAAQAYLNQSNLPDLTNGDEESYADKRASFSKTLPHNDLGEVELEAYAAFLSVLTSGDFERFEQIPRSPKAQMKLTSTKVCKSL